MHNAIRTPVLAVALGLLAALATAVVDAQTLPNPRERIDFWRANYTELTPQADARVREAQQIFQRVVRIAGRRHGVEPQLLIVREDPANVSLPIAIPDGWVVLSRKVLDICYRDPARGRDRLAFVLAHEVSHLLEDDFWHIKFFQALDSLRGGQSLQREVRAIAQQSNKVQAKELRADEMGIVYLAMAGYDPAAISGDSVTDNFFSEWMAAIDPARVTGGHAATHPGPAQRATAVRARLQQVTEQAGLFSLGVLLYQSGDFERAIQAFAEFRRYFPGREVHHNLASAQHQLALRHWRPAAEAEIPVLRLSMAVDPLSRANGTTRRSPSNAAAVFERNIQTAIENYQLAIAQDPAYLPAHRNLGAAHVQRGEPYKAIAVLQDALKLAPEDTGVLNNLGAAFLHAGNREQARNMLQRALASDARHEPALYNLALLEQLSGAQPEALDKARSYLALDSTSHWADTLRARLNLPGATDRTKTAGARGPESVPGLDIGAYSHEIPKTWGRTGQQRYKLGERTVQVTRHNNGVVTVSEGEEVRLIVAGQNYAAASARGIRIGSRSEEVLEQYGTPSDIQHSTTGESLLYPASGVTFNFRHGRVISWLHYWN